MVDEQRESNPDVNSYNPDVEPGENADQGDDDIPVPPGTTPPAEIKEPPGHDGPPVGDVDDSPKKIVG